MLLNLDVIPGQPSQAQKSSFRGRKGTMSALIEARREDYRRKVVASKSFLSLLGMQEQALNELSRLLDRARRYHESIRAMLMREYTKKVADEMRTPPHATIPKLKAGHRIKDSDKAACIGELMTSDLYLDMLLTNAYDVAVLDQEPTYEGL